ncbi:uncharacterized protein LOC143539846 [Bidens hawaiensis]|uniref:uncharacterized protein LOC143539846 n=1 Tax=Bidens hawaiensis TaxID=980011 RepID=UPI00404AC07B
MMLFAKDMIVPTSFNLNPNIPGHNKRLRRVFRGEVGTLDGTLIHVVLPTKEQDLYRGKGKWGRYQNILAICDFNMIFTFIGQLGREKYYLCDAAYAHTRGFMAPYRNVSYLLRDFRRRRALTNKEKFNHAHAKLRNYIERSFGVLKARFPILKRMAPFSLEAQRNLTVACFELQNFIRKEGLSDELFEQYDQPDVLFRNTHVHVADEDEIEAHGTASDCEYMTQLRDEIAEQLMQGAE